MLRMILQNFAFCVRLQISPLASISDKLKYNFTQKNCPEINRVFPFPTSSVSSRSNALVTRHVQNDVTMLLVSARRFWTVYKYVVKKQFPSCLHCFHPTVDELYFKLIGIKFKFFLVLLKCMEFNFMLNICLFP